MIIDTLTHITKDGYWFDTAHDASLSRLIRVMKEAKVDKSLLVSNRQEDNEVVLSTYKKFPEKFIPIGAVKINGFSDKKIEKMMVQMKTEGFHGIKIHPRLLRLSLLSKEINAALFWAANLDLVSLVCTIHRHPAPVLGRPLYDVIHELCENHSQTKMVLLHGGYYDLLAVSEIIRPYENVLLDLSVTLIRFLESSIGNDIRFLVKRFDQRLVVGSDFPEYTFTDVLIAFEKLGFSREYLNNKGILGDNFKRFFH
jgi:predicted TIM-barrel fold metal-dependent hydrolase